jgi:Uma2 family endonuclease
MLLTKTKSATIKDYEALPFRAPYQLIGGELIMSPSPTPYHQRISGILGFALTSFVESKRLGLIFVAPLDIRLTDGDVYQPDVMFVRKERVHLIGRDKFNIVPDLVIEILSPSNAYYDFTRKKAMYCEHGVEEYWIVDPEDQTIEIMIKDGEYYRTESLLRKPAVLESQMFPGFSMKLEEVFAF